MGSGPNSAGSGASSAGSGAFASSAATGSFTATETSSITGSGGANANGAEATGTGTSTGGQLSSGSATLACLEYVLGFCEYIGRCGGDLEGVIPCFESNRESCPDVLFAPGSARTVDDTFACADAWRALACDVLRPECATAGTLPNGQPCVSGIQCTSRVCSGSPVACGTCLQSAELGEPCDDAAGPVCGAGLVCHAARMVCVSNTAPAVGGLQLGEACDPATSDCYPNLCLSDNAGVYHCEPYPTLGDDCSFVSACAYGDSYCSTEFVCLALPEAGEPCGIDGAIGTAQWCAEGLSCDTTLDPPRCLRPPDRPGLGDPCEGICQAGLTCSCEGDACPSGTCLWARFNGESCTSSDETCLMGECLDGACAVTEVESTFAELCGG
ncbi:MAG TPA: hypothetical protein VI197_33530 [Polyangiaceae bacterium]